MSEELKPCPFCGGDANAEPESQHMPDCYFDLLARLKAAPKSDLSLVPAVIKAWNRRAQPAEAEGAVETGSDAWMALHLLDRLDVSADEEPRVQQVEEIVRRMGAALSAVTAERDQSISLTADYIALLGEAGVQIDQLRAEVEALRKAFGECIQSLHDEMLQSYGGQKPHDMHPATRRNYDRDMAEIAEYRAAMAAKEA